MYIPKKDICHTYEYNTKSIVYVHIYCHTYKYKTEFGSYNIYIAIPTYIIPNSIPTHIYIAYVPI